MVVSCSRFFNCWVIEKNGTVEVVWRPPLWLSLLFLVLILPSIVGVCLPILVIALLYGVAYGLTYRKYSALKAQIEAALAGEELPIGPGSDVKSLIRRGHLTSGTVWPTSASRHPRAEV